jgi:hypothetical protein
MGAMAPGRLVPANNGPMNNDVPHLPAETKERIRLEELYRQQARRALATEASWRDKFWTRANSPLAVVLLSSIVITAATWVIKNAVEHQAATKQQRAETLRISEEIDGRLNYFVIGLDAREKFENTSGPFQLAKYLTSYMRGSPAGSRQVLSFYPEYAQTPLVALVRLLPQRLSGDRHKKAMALSEKIINLYYEASFLGSATSPHEVDAFVGDLHEFQDGLFSGKYSASSIVQ